MTDGGFPSALREVRKDLSQRPVHVGVLVLGAILGISGPFGTLEAMTVLPRLAYWVTVVAVTFAIGSLIDMVINTMLRGCPVWVRFVLITACIGLAVTIFVRGFNFLVFGTLPETMGGLAEQVVIVMSITAVVELGVFALVGDRSAQQRQGAPLLQRLPLDKRGPLLALSAEDHYVDVRTTRGSEMVLMRLSDAVNEVGDVEGLQIHRSHWVALDQITKVEKISDRGEVTLSDGSKKPISRGYMPAVRDAGLLPKARGG